MGTLILFTNFYTYLLVMATCKIMFRQSRCRGRRGSLLVRVIHNRKVKVFTTDLSVFPEEWELLKRYLDYPCAQNMPPELMGIANDLDDLRDDLVSLGRKLALQGEYKVEDLIFAYQSRHNGDSLKEFVYLIIRELRQIGQERTARAYRSTLTRILVFSGGRDVKFQSLNGCFVKAFELALKRAGLMLNTVSFYLRNLRAIYNKGISYGLVPPLGGSPFRNLRISTQQTRKRALSLEQMRQLNGLDFSSFLEGRFDRMTPVHGLVRSLENLNVDLYCSWRLFLFSFHARGMSFVDMAYLLKENMRGNTISYYRRKTGGFIELRVNSEMRWIINSFRRDVEHTKFLFPVICFPDKPERMQYESGLRKQNSLLKLLAGMADIKENITTHVARHSWATIAKREKLSLEIISEGLGHSDIKTTGIYLDSFERHVLDKASERVSIAICKPASENAIILPADYGQTSRNSD